MSDRLRKVEKPTQGFDADALRALHPVRRGDPTGRCLALRTLVSSLLRTCSAKKSSTYTSFAAWRAGKDASKASAGMYAAMFLNVAWTL